MDYEKIEEIFKSVMTLIGLLCLAALIIGLPLWLLWNAVIPDVFGLPHISFWQAVGLNLIANILFKTMSLSSNKTK